MEKKKITLALKALIIIPSVATLLPASIRARLPPHAEAMEEEPVEVGGEGCTQEELLAVAT